MPYSHKDSGKRKQIKTSSDYSDYDYHNPRYFYFQYSFFSNFVLIFLFLSKIQHDLLIPNTKDNKELLSKTRKDMIRETTVDKTKHKNSEIVENMQKISRESKGRGNKKDGNHRTKFLKQNHKKANDVQTEKHRKFLAKQEEEKGFR